MKKLFTTFLFLSVFFQTIKAAECPHPENSVCFCKLIKKASDIIGVQCHLLNMLPSVHGEPKNCPSVQQLFLQQARLQNGLSYEFNQLLLSQQLPPPDQFVKLSILLIFQMQLQMSIIKNWDKRH
ncbi:hypothetical protein [Candidatus Sororendozoicomonas aggregata]|uniref:hypothetical protein n=1 Tax=Candidatus Sororendozoicomonas aggregata TaxID=3073239 RepID=UPI002ED5CD2E